MVVVLLKSAQFLGRNGMTCGFRKVTGLHCPGCGGTRAAHDLLAGDIIPAFGHNALLISGAFLFALLCAYLIVRITILGRPAPRLPDISLRWVWLGVGVIALFTVLRNLPPFQWLAP